MGTVGLNPSLRFAFTLIELLVVVAVVGLLVALVIPTLAGGLASAKGTVCKNQLRQITMACHDYAQDAGGWSPALGVPWGRRPFWALEAAARLGVPGETATEIYANAKVLVCPSAQAEAGFPLERTYAINVTGHAGLVDAAASPPIADPDNYDEQQAFIKLHAVRSPSLSPLMIDATWTDAATNAPPTTRFISTIDFRSDEHVATRIGWWHSGGRSNHALVDGAVRSIRFGEPIDDLWRKPLP